MKNYLLDTFKFNDLTNRKLLNKIKLLPDKTESIKLFSHLINSQYKWMARVTQNPDSVNMSWWEPVYELKKLEEEWTNSLELWINYLNSKTDEELSREITYPGIGDEVRSVQIKDIALQLNYHSIHHRAQIQTIIRQQGLEPDFVDYIGTRYRILR